MPMWGNTDTTGNSALFAPAQYNLTPNSANRDALYANSTADAFHTGETIGMYGVSEAEMTAHGHGGVDSITITAAGTGYTARPTVTIGAPNDTNGVQATATLVGKAVTIALNGPGTAGSYVPGEVLAVSGGAPAAGNAAAVVTHTEARVAIPTAGANGSNYAPGDVVALTDGTGTPATFTIATVTANAVATITATPTARGDYTVNPTLISSVTTNSTGVGTGLHVDVSMRAKTVAISRAGAYTTLPTLSGATTTGSATGTGATLDLTIGAGDATMTAKGSGYSAAPTLTFGGAGGTDTAGTAHVVSTASGLTSPGWAIRTEGSGGRAGRVRWETLVAMGSIGSDTTDDTTLPE